MDTFDTSILQSGDALLYYDPRSIVDRIIAIKTGGRISHIELWDGSGMSVASRNGIGVNRYHWRLDGLVAVRRPFGHIDWAAGQKWFLDDARGQKYDFKGLLCFYLAVKQGSPHKMFCSEFALCRYRHSVFQPFNPDQDADRTSPWDFWKARSMETIWQLHGFQP